MSDTPVADSVAGGRSAASNKCRLFGLRHVQPARELAKLIPLRWPPGLCRAAGVRLAYGR